MRCEGLTACVYFEDGTESILSLSWLTSCPNGRFCFVQEISDTMAVAVKHLQ